MQVQVYKYRLYPTPAQEKALVKTLLICRYWYNMCLGERKLAWELEQRTVTKGEQEVPNPGWYRAAQAELRSAQRSLQRKAKGGQNRKKALHRVQHVHEHVADIRRDFLNKQVYRLVHRYDGIAVEDLRIANMVRKPHLAKSILDSGWGYFKEQLARKAVNADREVVFVNPAYTSRCCSACGAEFPHFSLATRWVDCACGLSLDRDHNAALNILHRAGWVTSVSANVDAPGHALLRSPRL